MNNDYIRADHSQTALRQTRFKRLRASWIKKSARLPLLGKVEWLWRLLTNKLKPKFENDPIWSGSEAEMMSDIFAAVAAASNKVLPDGSIFAPRFIVVGISTADSKRLTSPYLTAAAQQLGAMLKEHLDERAPVSSDVHTPVIKFITSGEVARCRFWLRPFDSEIEQSTAEISARKEVKRA